MMIDSAAPRIVTVPEGVTFAQAQQAIALCTRLGVLPPSPGGWIIGVVSPGEGVLDLTPDRSVPAPAHLVEAFEDALLHRPVPVEDVADVWPEVQVARGGIRFPASAHASAGVGPPAAPELSTTGWCAPSDFISNGGPIPISPEDAARIEYELRPCGGEHRWERYIHRLQCGCAQCAGEERYLECAGCGTERRDDTDGFDELWEGALWA